MAVTGTTTTVIAESPAEPAGTVKEIHDGMGLHGPRIHELATGDKVRHDKPELAEDGMKCGPG